MGTLTANQKILLDLLEQMERTVSDLYDAFAQAFPTHAELWTKLSAEEQQHASHIKNLACLAENGKVLFTEKMTTPTAVQAVIHDIRAKQQRVQHGDFDLMKALAFGLSLEQAIIEHKFYDYFRTDDAETLRMIRTIQEETNAHAFRIRKALDEQKKS